MLSVICADVGPFCPWLGLKAQIPSLPVSSRPVAESSADMPEKFDRTVCLQRDQCMAMAQPLQQLLGYFPPFLEEAVGAFVEGQQQDRFSKEFPKVSHDLEFSRAGVFTRFDRARSSFHW